MNEGGEDMTLAMRRKWARNDKQIQKNVRQILSGSGKDKTTLAQLLGISERTLYARLKTPSDFSVREIRVLKWVAEKHGIKLKNFE